MRRLLLLALLIGLLVGGSWLWFQHWAPSRDIYPIQGVDVSHHQGPIDWGRVRAAGADFAYVKASEGGDFRDGSFADNWAGAAAAGLRRGAYHFFSLCAPGSRQAENFIALVPRDDGALPPAVDLEFGGNCAARPPRETLLREIEAFIRMAEAHSEKPVMLYLTREFDEYYRVSEVIDRPLWLRRILMKPTYGERPWVMWQANPRRRIAGIEGPVDWNVVRPQ